MNTPKPCDKCIYLYYDVMAKDDPSYMAECKLVLPMGLRHCSEFKYWKKASMNWAKVKKQPPDLTAGEFNRREC